MNLFIITSLMILNAFLGFVLLFEVFRHNPASPITGKIVSLNRAMWK
jgi:hypothetical protein